jgi:hypothetical protein
MLKGFFIKRGCVNRKMRWFLKHQQIFRESNNYPEPFIPGNWMLSYTQNLSGIHCFDLPKGEEPM